MLKHQLSALIRSRLQIARARTTQTELAARTGIAQETLSKIERGRQNSITEEQLERVAAATGVTRAWLLGQSNEGGPESSDAENLASGPAIDSPRHRELAAELLSQVWSYPLRGATEASWAVKESDVLRGDLGTAREDPGLGVAIITTELALKAFGSSACAGRIAGCTSWAMAKTERNAPHRLVGQIRDRRENVVIEERPDFRHTVAFAVVLARAKPEHSYLQSYVELVLDAQRAHAHGGWPAESLRTISPVMTACYAVELLHLVLLNPLIPDGLRAKIPSAIDKGLAWLMKLRTESSVQGLWTSPILDQYAWDGLWVTAWLLHRLALIGGVHVPGWQECLEDAFSQMIEVARAPRTWTSSDDAQRFRVETRVGAAVAKILLSERLSKRSREAALIYAQSWKARAEGWAKRQRLQEMDVATAAFLVWGLAAESDFERLGRVVLEHED
jgi:transcriptional regulator with XRE-family HTH domain